LRRKSAKELEINAKVLKKKDKRAEKDEKRGEGKLRSTTICGKKDF